MDRITILINPLCVQEAEWKKMAANSIRRVTVLEYEIQNYRDKLVEKDRQISHLRSLPPRKEPPPPSHYSALGLVILVGVVATLASFLVWETKRGGDTPL